MSDTFERKVKLKHKFILAASLAVILSVSAFATTAFAATTNSQSAVESTTGNTKKCGQNKKEKVAEPENAIGKDKAKAAALKEVGVSEDKVEKIKARVTKLDDGTVVYKVGFTSGDQYYSVKINALTGAVVDKTVQSAEEHEASKSHGKHEQKEKVAEPENAIGKDKAKAAALKEAGITEDKAEKIKSRVTKLDDGTVVYKVSFTSGDKYYSIKVNALTGAVAEKKEQSAEEHASLKTHSKSDSTKTTDSTENAKS